MARVRDRLIDVIWRSIEGLGPRGRQRFVAVWGQTIGRLPMKGHRNWARNITIATGERPSRAQVRQAAASWLRNALESVTLEHWTSQEIDDSVLIADEDWERLKQAYHGPGAVLALGHLGSWDLCGAWVCQRGMAVSSVAERLADARFEHFLQARREMGMRIHVLDDPDVFRKLAADVHQGRLVCLLADRDLKGTGTTVTWPNARGGRPITVPPGPAVLARRTGTELLVVTSHYEGQKMRISISEPIQHRDGPEGTAAMMQDVITHLAATVKSHPADWHVMGRFFKE